MPAPARFSLEQQLAKLGHRLPLPPRPAGAYQPWIRVGSLLQLSGQFPIEHDVARFTGRVGAELTESEARAAAELAALNVLAQLHSALSDDLAQLESLTHLQGHVAAAPGWTQAPKILDAASSLLMATLGPRGAHSRSAFVPAALPLNHSIELIVTAAVLPP